jgi:hypothetical protein
MPPQSGLALLSNRFRGPIERVLGRKGTAMKTCVAAIHFKWWTRQLGPCAPRPKRTPRESSRQEVSLLLTTRRGRAWPDETDRQRIEPEVADFGVHDFSQLNLSCLRQETSTTALAISWQLALFSGDPTAHPAFARLGSTMRNGRTRWGSTRHPGDLSRRRSPAQSIRPSCDRWLLWNFHDVSGSRSSCRRAVCRRAI